MLTKVRCECGKLLTAEVFVESDSVILQVGICSVCAKKEHDKGYDEGYTARDDPKSWIESQNGDA